MVNVVTDLLGKRVTVSMWMTKGAPRDADGEMVRLITGIVRAVGAGPYNVGDSRNKRSVWTAADPNNRSAEQVDAIEQALAWATYAESLMPRAEGMSSVWTVTPSPYDGAHFATFPPKLITPCILAGSRPGDLVLDPFFGSGTTGQVAETHERAMDRLRPQPQVRRARQGADGAT